MIPEGQAALSGQDTDAIFGPDRENPLFAAILRRILRGERPDVGGATGALCALLALHLHVHQRTLRPLVLLLPAAEDAETALEDLVLLGCPRASIHLLSPGGEQAHARAATVLRWRQKGGILLASARSAVEPMLDAGRLASATLRLFLGQKNARSLLIAACEEAGLLREPQVVAPGSFSVRGDVVDVFLRPGEAAVRIEFLDDEVEGIREFAPETQLSVAVLDETELLFLPPSEGLAGGTDATLGSHLFPDDLMLVRDPLQQEEALERHLVRFLDAERRVIRAAYERVIALRPVLLSRLPLSGDGAMNLDGHVIAAEGTGFESALGTLDRVAAGKSRILLAFDTEGEMGRFLELRDADPGRFAWMRTAQLRTAIGRFSQGFHSPGLGVAALSYCELFAIFRERRADAPKAERASLSGVGMRPIDSFLSLAAGDYVVHLTHGIGRFLAMERTERGGFAQDFLKLEFAGEVHVLVPVTRIDLVQKYVGGKGEAPELSKLGGVAWGRRKEKVAEALTEFAAELIEMQALRAQKRGIAHPPDSPWQQEFEAAFPFTLTSDQANAIEEIKKDLESPRPMDRLICGDVGYGKTEVAMRAAFKVVMGERQVAVLVPTTVLAEQHYETFRTRMKDYPVAVECLSRFRSARDERRVVEEAAAGRVDVLIGTHRILQPDLGFLNLGLLIIDEEQRFGVVDKERLRRLRRDVDVLTLTATPIPRTLHQAMVGIRDISALTEAPRGRRGIETQVVTASDELIRGAVRRELDRQGQVFFVHNRVHSIHGAASKLMELVPEARIVVGHGQMGERSLEKAMLDFVEHRADVLVATTIIESGLDIPRANTLFVDDADAYGLSELHQLRGRVGRHHHQAYAYFLVKPDRVVSEVAEKRLRAIEEFARLGAGFQIAMRDLEIRGAGNILGTEQSGHIAAVGYELYCRLLGQAVRKAKKEDVGIPDGIEINIDFTAFLPEGYIPDQRTRIEVYRKLGRAREPEEFEALFAEMRDRFGPIPEKALEFVCTAQIRAVAERNHIRRVEMLKGEGVLLFVDRPGEFAARRVRPSVRPRILDGKYVLLPRRSGFAGPRELLAFLESALPGQVTAASWDRVRP